LLQSDQQHPPKSYLLIGSILFLSVMVILLSSKAGLLTLALIIMLAAVYSWKRMKLKLAGLVILGSGVMLFVLGYWLVPVAFSRISAAGHAVKAQPEKGRVQAESNADRMAVWVTAIEIIKKNYVFGVGTGDVKDALMEGYKKNGLIPAYEHKFNAHNQYLQTFVTLGLAGFLALVAILLLPALRALKGRQDLYLAFLLIFAMNILFESMLEIQAGVVFYAFFNAFLFSVKISGDPVS
jgi:O-antigen ligase